MKTYRVYYTRTVVLQQVDVVEAESEEDAEQQVKEFGFWAGAQEDLIEQLSERLYIEEDVEEENV